MLRARLFGPLSIEIDGRPVPDIAGLRPRSVLAWLLLHPGPHSRARVASLFWPDVLDISARASLRNALWGIRHALDAAGGSAYLEASRDNVAIAARLPRDVDTEKFTRLAGRDDAASLAAALTLVRAPLLTDLTDDWVLDARESLREDAAATAARLADLCERDRDLPAAVQWTRREIEHVPVRESAYRALMRRLAEAGERGEALATFDRCRAVLAAEFGTVPSEETLALADVLKARRPREAPPRRAIRERVRPPDTARSPDSRVIPSGDTHPPPETSAQEPALVCRSAEFATLSEAWEQACRGRGGVVLVSGAAGLGKSRLAAELAGRAAREGARCATGAAFELEGAPPYGPWAEMLPELVADLPPPPREAAWPADLARLCRSVEWRWARPASKPSSDPEQERRWLFESVVEAVCWCSAAQPLLLVVEDIHLADPASVALLAYTGRRLTQLPALLVATRRPAAARTDLALTVDALTRRDALVAEVVLGPLPPADIDTIVRSCAPDLDGDARARVVAAADGNPLLARRAALAAIGGNDPSAELRDWIRAPLARLAGPAKLLVDAAALLGRPMDTGEAAALVGAQELPTALGHACREELLSTEGRKINFGHGLVRQACRTEIEAPRAAWLHGMLAEMLDQRPDRPVTEIARHLLGTGQWERAQRYLTAAAEKARALGAFDDAAACYWQAAAVLDVGAAALRAELWLALADVNAWRGRLEEHDAAFDRARELLEQAGEPAALANAFALRGRCLRTTLCYPAEALRAYRRALELIDTEGLEVPELRAIVLAGLGWLEVASGDVTRGEAFLERARSLPEAEQDPGLAAELALARAAALLRTGRSVDSERECDNAVALARRAGRPDMAGVGLLQAVSACAARGAFDRALGYADRVRQLRPGTRVEGEALAARAYTLARTGRKDGAWAAAQQEVRLVGHAGDDEQEAAARFDAGSVALSTGHAAEAAELLAAVLAERAGRFPRALARVRLAAALLRTNDPEASVRELERVPFEPVSQADFPETLVPQVERVEALLAAERGELDLALNQLASVAAVWRRMLRAAPADDPYAASLVDLTGRPVGGMLEPGVELARVLAERAVLLDRVGSTEQAHAAAAEAAALADRLGYGGYRQTLRALEGTTVMGG